MDKIGLDNGDIILIYKGIVNMYYEERTGGIVEE